MFDRLGGILAACVLVASCGDKPAPASKWEAAPLTGVGGNPYCVTDVEERRLASLARSDMMAAWVLIHHYQQCKLDRDRAAMLLQLQLSKDEHEVMDALAAFNARVEAGRKANAEK